MTRHRVHIGLIVAALAAVHASAAPAANQEIPKMSQAPSSSRPAPVDVPPIEHAGVRYIQDRFDERDGDQAGGYLAAVDIATGTRLWRLKVYPVSDVRAAGVSGGMRLFRSMRLSADARALVIENESGGVYRVDLATCVVTQVSGPPANAAAGADAPPKPKP